MVVETTILRALLLDMDGTLTRPRLDFDLIRSDMGITGPILEAMARMDAERQRRAWEILDRHERAAAENSELNPGCVELLETAAAMKLRCGLITRNSRESVQTVLGRHGLSFEVILSREDEPTKPSPEPIFRACEQLGVEAASAWMIGDGHHDIEAGLAAGATTVWISHGQPRDFSAQPCIVVDSLFGVVQHLQQRSQPRD